MLPVSPRAASCFSYPRCSVISSCSAVSMTVLVSCLSRRQVRSRQAMLLGHPDQPGRCLRLCRRLGLLTARQPHSRRVGPETPCDAQSQLGSWVSPADRRSLLVGSGCHVRHSSSGRCDGLREHTRSSFLLCDHLAPCQKLAGHNQPLQMCAFKRTDSRRYEQLARSSQSPHAVRRVIRAPDGYAYTDMLIRRRPLLIARMHGCADLRAVRSFYRVNGATAYERFGAW